MYRVGCVVVLVDRRGSGSVRGTVSCIMGSGVVSGSKGASEIEEGGVVARDVSGESQGKISSRFISG